MLDEAATRMVDFLGSDDGAEFVWLGALAAIERAVDEARTADPWLWRSRASSLVARLEHELRRALDLARLASDAETARANDLAADLLAATKAVHGRSQQTVPAELARRVNAENRRREREGLPRFEPTPEWEYRAVAAIRARRPLPFPPPEGDDRDTAGGGSA